MTKHNVLSENYYDPTLIERLSENFFLKGYVKLPSFFNETVSKSIKNEIKKLKGLKLRKDFVMPDYKTPRNLSVLGGSIIKENSDYISKLYDNDEVLDFMKLILKNNVFRVTHPEEFMVVNFLDYARDTHGWHLDDPELALVIVVKSPKNADSANVEIINNWSELLNNYEKEFDERLNIETGHKYFSNRIEKISLNDSDAYLLHASNALHRVSPIIGDDERIALNMAYSLNEKQFFGETANLLYGNTRQNEYV